MLEKQDWFHWIREPMSRQKMDPRVIIHDPI